MAKKRAHVPAVQKPAPENQEMTPEIQEIAEIAARLDDAGLEALLNAAHALETKGKIDAFNRELNVAAAKASKRRRELSTPNYGVHIERTEDDFFIIALDDVRVFFNRAELREITRICHTAAASNAPNPSLLAARKLFRWFEKERSDLLVDAGINSERSPYLAELFQVVVSTYKVKE